MSIAMVLKIFSDCCICFAILGSGPISFPIPLLLPALICGVIAGVATFFAQKNWRVLRLVCGLLPMLCLLLGNDQMQRLLLAVPSLYTAIVIVRGKLELEYYSYRKFFLQSLALLVGTYVIVNIWIFLSAATGNPTTQLDGGVILRYGIVHLLCGIVLQRQLRLGVENNAKSNRRQASMLLGAGGAVIFSFLAAEPLLRQHFLGLLRGALLLLGVPIMLIIELFAKIIELLGSAQQETQGQIVQGTTPGFSSGMLVPPGATVPAEPGETVAKEIDPMLLWGALVVVLLIIAAVILVTSFQKRRASGEIGEIKISVVTAQKKKRDSVLSNRHKVRQFYREFLRTENGWGLKLKKSDTSADVLRRIRPETDKKSAADLRQVYLLARYDDRVSISRNQVNAAKQALKGTKKTGKQ